MSTSLAKIGKQLVTLAQRPLQPRPEPAAPPPILLEAIPFQDEIEQVILRPSGFLLNGAHYTVAAMFITLLVVAGLFKVDVVVVGGGRLAADAPPIVLQPIDRAVIRELRVRAGDVVTKGQILATLDPTFAQADLSSLLSQQRAVTAHLDRLQAEADGKPYEVVGSSDPDALLQTEVYRQRQAEYTSRLKTYDQDIAQLQASIATTDGDRSSLSTQMGVLQSIENMRSELLKTESGSKLQLLQSQSDRMRVEQSYHDAINRLAELQHTMQSKQAERQSFMDQWRSQLLQELVTTRTDASKIADEVAKSRRLHDFVTITAPADGVILEVAKLSVGSVMTEAQPLIKMLPSDAPLMADISIASGDIGYTKPGDRVAVKVDAFPFQRHGVLEGKLRSVSEESFSTGEAAANDGAPPSPGAPSYGAVHRGQVSFTDAKLHDLPDGAHLIPGMTVSAEIKVGERSVLSYFLYPLTRGLSESVREP